MTRTQQALGVLLLAAAGLWGCAGGDASAGAKQFEARVAKLEADLKATTAARDGLKTRLAALEDQVRTEAERARTVEKERDDLAAKLAARTAEKDVAVTSYDDLVKKLEGVLGQAKTAQAKVREVPVPATVTSRVRD